MHYEVEEACVFPARLQPADQVQPGHELSSDLESTWQDLRMLMPQLARIALLADHLHAVSWCHEDSLKLSILESHCCNPGTQTSEAGGRDVGHQGGP